MGLVNSVLSFFSYPEETEETKDGTGITKDTKSEEKTGNNATLSPVQNGLPGTNENSVSRRSSENQSPVQPQEIEDVDRKNIIVKFRGMKITVDVFPLEKIFVIKENACREVGVNKEHFQLVYEGEIMDETKTVNEYNLRGGKEVSLIPRK